ncbi:MAG: Rpn family recombination-promoting nuclease/putative transposase, partial [Gammaproteobacteria bacterium]|nr:Rpn family recombination-promoting nuclease/putative transposase [Gammaproteobacteria bacterium]
FFQSKLPRMVLEKIDLSTLRMENATFIDARLRKNESDLIFSVKQIDSRKAYLFVMLEHQSQSDPLMPFRVLYYTLHGIRRHVLRNKKKPLPLPLVYPLIVYNGVDPWSHDRDFFNLFGEMSSLAREVFLNPFQLLDVGTLAPTSFERTHIATLMLMSLYRSLGMSLEQKIEILVDTCHEFGIHPDSEMGRTVLEYNTYLFEAKQGESGKYWEMYVSHFPPQFQESVMNLLDVTRNESKAEGRVEGRVEGVNSTVQAVNLLRQGRSLEEVSRLTGIDIEILKILRPQVVH